MKYFALFFIVTAFFIGGKSVESQRDDDLTEEEQKQKLDKRIPPEILAAVFPVKANLPRLWMRSSKNTERKLNKL